MLMNRNHPSRQVGNKLKKPSLPFFSTITLGGVIGFVLSIALLYFLILDSGTSVLSLSGLLTWIEHLSLDEQLLTVLLLPIYLGLLVFGGGLLGAKLGEFVQKKIRPDSI